MNHFVDLISKPTLHNFHQLNIKILTFIALLNENKHYLLDTLMKSSK